MNLEKFRLMSKRDFENGAVLNEIECVFEQRDLLLLAATAVSKSSFADFDSGARWGIWCREILNAAIFGDNEEVERLIEALPELWRPSRDA